MIDRTGIADEVYLECDVCGETEEGFDTFYDAVEFKRDKTNGWRSTNINGAWHDMCPNCKISDIRSNS